MTEDESVAGAIELAAQLGEGVAERMAEARDACIPTVRRLEEALAAALDGSVLRGLPLIGPELRAAKVRGRKDGQLRDRESLVLSERGQLVMARMVGTTCETRPARDVDLRVEDVDDVARTIVWAVERYQQHESAVKARVGAIVELAELLTQALGRLK